jgi:K+-transporting ATPase ATPase C chain
VKQHLINSVLMTAVLTIMLGLVYPLGITAISQLLFRDKANGQLIVRDNQVIGSRLIGQPFTSRGYFHSRPSAAGAGYDAANSGGSNLAPTNAQLTSRVNDAARTLGSGVAVPVDLVTTSGSGLDPDITPAAAYYQAARVARERHIADSQVIELVRLHTQPRQWGFLGEPRVNVLELNLALDRQGRH